MPAGVSAWTPLANITLGSPAASITFSSISQSYRDLIIVSNSYASGGAGQIYYRFNSDGASNYFYTFILGDGSVTNANTWNNQSLIYTTTYTSDQSTVASRISTTVANIMDYSVTDKHKTALVRNSADLGAIFTNGRWASTSAITSVTVGIGSNSFAAGSTFALYGVSA